MTTFRNALLGTCLALPLAALAGHAQAAQPHGERVIYVPPGATVVILPGPGAIAAPNMVNAGMPDAMPMMRLIAQQQAVIQHMIADMNAMFQPLPDPGQSLRAAFGPGAWLNVSLMPMAGGVSLMPMAGGHSVCSQRISIVDRGDGSVPVVTTTQSGDACGPLSVTRPQSVNDVPPAVPAPSQHGPKLLQIGYPPHPVSANTPPRT